MAGTQVTGTTFNEKWIEGGTANQSPLFNIDDPIFWTPMSVMNGLASGFCERIDAVVTGATFSQHVPEVAANLAAGTVPNADMTNMQTQIDVPFVAPGATGSNYMKSTDLMLSKIIATGAYVKVDGSTYSGFSDLATTAKNRSSSYQSDCGVISSNGGSLMTAGSLAYPAVWAKQRKWMLDELRVTISPRTLSYVTAVTGYFISGFPTSSKDGYEWQYIAGDTVTSMITGATNLYNAWLDGCTALASYPMQDADALSFKTDMWKSGDSLIMGTPDQWTTGYQTEHNRPAAYITATVNNPSSSQDISIYLAPVCYMASEDVVFNESGFTIVTGTVTASSNTGYTVKSGGILTIPSTYKNGSVSVYSGGHLILVKSSIATNRPINVNIISGGTLTFSGYTNNESGLNLPFSGHMFFDYYPAPIQATDGFTYLNSAFTKTITTDSYYIIDGATGSITGQYQTIDLWLFNGSNVTLSGVLYGTVVVGPGCRLTYDDTVLNSAIKVTVMPGGVLTCTKMHGEPIIALPGAVVESTNSYLEDLCVVEGATVSLTGTSVGYTFIGTFCGFGLDVAKGWNYYHVPNGATTGQIFLTGSSVFADAVETARSVIGSIDNLNANKFPGTVNISGTTISFVDFISSARAEGHTIIWNNAKVLAVGGGSATGSPDNIYETFQCRQSKHDLLAGSS